MNDFDHLFKLFRKGECSEIPVENCKSLFEQYEGELSGGRCTSCRKKRVNRKYKNLLMKAIANQ